MRFAAIVAFVLAAAPAWAQQAEKKSLPLISNDTVTVTSDDFEAYLLRVPDKGRVEARSSFEWIGKAADTVFENRVLANEARRLGYDKDPVVALRIRQSEEALLAQVWADRFRKEMKLPDLEARARELYVSSKDKYVDPEVVSGHYVIVAYQGRTKEEARELAQSVRKLAVAGTSLEELALAYSDDPTAKRNKGKLEYTKKTELEPGVGAAVFALKPGEISQPLETQHGFVVIQLDKRLPARVKPFDEVKLDIVEEQAEKIRSLAVENAAVALKKPTTMTVETKNIESLRVPLDPTIVTRAHEEAMKAMAAREATAIK